MNKYEVQQFNAGTTEVTAQRFNIVNDDLVFYGADGAYVAAFSQWLSVKRT